VGRTEPARLLRQAGDYDRCIDADQLFLRTLTDLEQRTAATDEYEVLLAAGLPRKLLLDEYPLVDQVNRSHRIRLRFRMNGPSAYEEMVLRMGPATGPSKMQSIRTSILRPDWSHRSKRRVISCSLGE
jgi:hypothetical protein